MVLIAANEKESATRWLELVSGSKAEVDALTRALNFAKSHAYIDGSLNPYKDGCYNCTAVIQLCVCFQLKLAFSLEKNKIKIKNKKKGQKKLNNIHFGS